MMPSSGPGAGRRGPPGAGAGAGFGASAGGLAAGAGAGGLDAAAALAFLALAAASRAAMSAWRLNAAITASCARGRPSPPPEKKSVFLGGRRGAGGRGGGVRLGQRRGEAPTPTTTGQVAKDKPSPSQEAEHDIQEPVDARLAADCSCHLEK
jgi:hypothetical protein